MKRICKRCGKEKELSEFERFREIIMYQVKMKDFKSVKKEYTAREIIPTSYGYIIPIREVIHYKRIYTKEYHNYD